LFTCFEGLAIAMPCLHLPLIIEKDIDMKTVTSQDGTSIAYDQVGTGSTLILVGGALQHRAFDKPTAELADLLAPHFTVIHYDRRGRGDSGNTLPYAVEREIEDLDALIDAGGGSAFVYGISSGAALGMAASLRLGDKIKKLVMYEVPYNADLTARQAWVDFTRQLKELLVANRRGDAVALFLQKLGSTSDELQGMSHSPVWPLFEAVAPTIAYDAAILGAEADVPVEQARQVTIPTLLMAGGADSPYKHWMHQTVTTLAQTIPNAQHRILEGQNHFVSSDVLAPVLIEFFTELVATPTAIADHIKV
jgi:pimeloyl-ACP methyl ester carboxylesterase